MPQCSECGRSQPSPAMWYLLSSSTCTPMEWNSLWLRLSVSESETASTCRGAEGERWRAAPKRSVVPQHGPHHSGIPQGGTEPTWTPMEGRHFLCRAKLRSSSRPGMALMMSVEGLGAARGWTGGRSRATDVTLELSRLSAELQRAAASLDQAGLRATSLGR